MIVYGQTLDLNGEKNDESFYRDQFNRNLKNRQSFVINLINADVLKRDKEVISICCGVGGEESMFIGYAKRLVLLDQFKPQVDFMRKIYKEKKIMGRGTQVEFVSNRFELEQSNDRFDVVYCSSPSDYAYSPKMKLPEHYNIFFNKHLKKDGVVIFRIYGGFRTIKELSSDEMRKTLDMNFGVSNLTIQGYYVMDSLRTLLVVATKGNPNIAIFNYDRSITDV